jgi:hypothetical protein
MELIRAAGGVSVFAHPGVTHRDDLLPELASAGLQAIEVYSPAHTPKQECDYLKSAHDYGLLVSGGSDCHGTNKDRVLMGSVRLPDSKLEELRGASGSAR